MDDHETRVRPALRWQTKGMGELEPTGYSDVAFSNNREPGHQQMSHRLLSRHRVWLSLPSTLKNVGQGQRELP